MILSYKFAQQAAFILGVTPLCTKCQDVASKCACGGGVHAVQLWQDIVYKRHGIRLMSRGGLHYIEAKDVIR